MTVGLAFFYGGLVRKKNILGVMMQCTFLMGLMTVVWALWGYSLAFGGQSPYFGNLDYVFLRGVIPTLETPVPAPYATATAIPHMLFMVYQGMFFIITPALITGATADRMKFTAYMWFIGLWLILVYAPIAHWVFGGGWLFDLGALDFAGGAVVHISSGFAALVCALMLGHRRGYGTDYMAPHNLPLTLLGTGLLWFGWFGFNAGSALAADGLAANALLVTNTAAGAATLSWVLVSYLHRGKVSVIGAAVGAVAGLEQESRRLL